MEIDRRGKEGLICKDNIRADIKVTFFVRVNKTREDVLKVAQAIGCVRASRSGDAGGAVRGEVLRGPEDRRQAASTSSSSTRSARSSRTRSSRSSARTSTATCSRTAPSTTSSRPRSRCSTRTTSWTPQGIRKITELTTVQNVSTNELRQNERMAITKQQRRGGRGDLRLRAPARRGRGQEEARRSRRIQARETAEAERVKSEEHAKSRAGAHQGRGRDPHQRAEQAAPGRGGAEEPRARGRRGDRARREGPRSSRPSTASARWSCSASPRRRQVETAEEGHRRRHPRAHRRGQDGGRGGGAHQGPARDGRGQAQARTRCSSPPRPHAQEKLVKDIKAAEASERGRQVHAPRSGSPWPRRTWRPPTRRPRRRSRLAEGVQAETAARAWPTCACARRTPSRPRSRAWPRCA